MTVSLDDIMAQATQALGRMDYLTAETLCLQALAAARMQNNWAYYARILMPLQEARRQRRIIAAEGVIRLGASALPPPGDQWLGQVRAGCIAMTRPHTVDDARLLHDTARRHRLHVEVLFIDNPSDADVWRLRSFHDQAVACDFEAPPAAWREQWLSARQPPPPVPTSRGIKAPATPADWFLDASEALGDAALAHLDPPRRTQVAALERMLDVAPDHEILHQTLAKAARERGRKTAG